MLDFYLGYKFLGGIISIIVFIAIVLIAAIKEKINKK